MTNQDPKNHSGCCPRGKAINTSELGATENVIENRACELFKELEVVNKANAVASPARMCFAAPLRPSGRANESSALKVEKLHPKLLANLLRNF